VNWEEDARKCAALAVDAGGFDWLVVDHYRLDAHFERHLRRLGLKILVIDDLADRPHDCDLLLDQNLYRNLEVRYRGLLPESARTYLGPKYALLRPEFRQARRLLRPRQGALKHLLISFGGGDPTNETAKALAAMDLLGLDALSLDVVIGSSNPNASSLQAACAARPGCTLHIQADTMALLMSRADLALGGGGGTTWERCFLGLPTLTVVVAANQRLLTEAVAAFGAAWNLGWHADISPILLAQAITRLRGAPNELAWASARAFALMGEAERVAEHPLVTLMYGGSYDLR
jgi:UDP-2,4-diacetamido-2,4,6-trideoxy-beta-L-altropyranose hydrolase